MVNKLSKQDIDNILEPTIDGLGFEFVCSELANTNFSGSSDKKGSAILRIYIDKPSCDSDIKTGVTLDDCQLISRQVTRVLDVEAAVESADKINKSSPFRLEVSSPGLDRPLVKLSHYVRFIGKKVKIKLNVPIDCSAASTVSSTSTSTSIRNIVGYISAVIDEDNNKKVVVNNLDSKDIIYNIEFDNINKANLVPEW